MESSLLKAFHAWEKENLFFFFHSKFQYNENKSVCLFGFVCQVILLICITALHNCIFNSVSFSINESKLMNLSSFLQTKKICMKSGEIKLDKFNPKKPYIFSTQCHFYSVLNSNKGTTTKVCLGHFKIPFCIILLLELLFLLED